MAQNGEEKAGVRQEWRQLVSGGGLFAVVLGILIFGAVHETAQAPNPEPARASLAPLPAASPPPTAPPPAEPDPEPAGTLDPLSARSLEDPDRLARAAGEWTLQLAVACRRETASRLLERAHASNRLYVLPATVKDRACLRICWGSYASRDEAERAQDLPATLRADLERPEVKRIRELTP